jgi:hypothetical protein
VKQLVRHRPDTEKTEVESLDHLVRLQQQRRWDRQAKRFGSVEIQHKLELRGLLHREISWLCAFEYFIDEARGVTI